MNAAHWQPVFIGIGSNLENPIQQVQSALIELKVIASTSLVIFSDLYHSSPVGPQDQPDYVNAVAGLLTQLAPLDLLDHLQSVEQSHNRVRTGERWSARTLDLDILAYASLELASERLQLPHKELRNRDFVLGPWYEIAPQFRVPGLGTIEQLARRVDLSKLRRVRAQGVVR